MGTTTTAALKSLAIVILNVFTCGCMYAALLVADSALLDAPKQDTLVGLAFMLRTWVPVIATGATAGWLLTSRLSNRKLLPKLSSWLDAGVLGIVIGTMLALLTILTPLL